MTKLNLLLFPGVMATVAVPCTSLITNALAGLHKSPLKKKVRRWKTHYCHKWFYEIAKGELIVCPSDDYSQIAFFLWWLGDYDMSKNDGWGQYFFPVQKIEVSGSVISFVFEGNQEKDANKKLTISRWYQSNLSGLNDLKDQILSEVCKLETSGKFSCANNKYVQAKLDRSNFYLPEIQFKK